MENRNPAAITIPNTESKENNSIGTTPVYVENKAIISLNNDINFVRAQIEQLIQFKDLVSNLRDKIGGRANDHHFDKNSPDFKRLYLDRMKSIGEAIEQILPFFKQVKLDERQVRRALEIYGLLEKITLADNPNTLHPLPSKETLVERVNTLFNELEFTHDELDNRLFAMCRKARWQSNPGGEVLVEMEKALLQPYVEFFTGVMVLVCQKPRPTNPGAILMQEAFSYVDSWGDKANESKNTSEASGLVPEKKAFTQAELLRALEERQIFIKAVKLLDFTVELFRELAGWVVKRGGDEFVNVMVILAQQLAPKPASPSLSSSSSSSSSSAGLSSPPSPAKAGLFSPAVGASKPAASPEAAGNNLNPGAPGKKAI